MRQLKLVKENLKFDLTTFGFNDKKSPVPSGSLNRVPTVLLNFHMIGDGTSINANGGTKKTKIEK